MPDRELTYKVITTADLAGAVATQTAYEGIAQKADKVATSAAGAGVETGRFTDAAGRLREANGRFVETGNSVDEVKKHLSDASHEADHFASSLKAGVGIDLGHRLVELIAEVPAKIREMTEEGVRFNAMAETMKVGLAGAFRSADPDTFTSFHAAETAASEAFEAIKAKSIELGLDLHAVTEGLSINLRGLAEGGVRDLTQQIDLITTLNQAAAAKGLAGNQASRDIIDLLNGRANRTLFGAELGIKDEDVKAAREAGKLYEFLNEKLSAYKEGGQAAANTFAAAEQRLKTETEVLYGEISKPVFDVLKDALNQINELLKDGNVAEELSGMGHDIAAVASDGATLLRWGIEFAPVLFRVAEGVGAVSLAIALLKLPGIISSLGQKSLAWLKNAESIDTETAALNRNTLAAEENALAKKGVPGAGAGGAVAGAAGGGFFSTAGAGAAIGTGMVALEAGYALIKLWESAKNAEIDAIKDRSEAESASIVAMQTQVDLADTVTKKDKARAELKKEIAELEAKIKAAETSDFTPDGAGGGVYSDADPDATTLDRERLRSKQHQLDTFDRHAGKKDTERHANEAREKREKDALDDYHKTDEYQLDEAELTGNQQGIDDYSYNIEVAKIKKELMEKRGLSEAEAKKEAERRATGHDLTKQRKSLDPEVDRLGEQFDKQRDSASIGQDLAAKRNEFFGALPGVTPGDLPGAVTAMRAMPEGTQEEIDQKTKLRDLLKQIADLRKDEETAKRREDAAKGKSDGDAKAAADLKKQHDETISAERLEVDILRARATGHEAEARQLERKRDLQREINRLMQAGLTDAEAEPLARDAVKLKDDAADAKKDERGAGRGAREPRGDRDKEHVVIHGYHDPDQDAGGGLHGGGLTSGGLHTGSLNGGSSRDRFAGRPDAAAAALAKHRGDPEHDPAARRVKLTGDPDHDPLARLAKAPDYVPSFPPRKPKPLFAPGADPVSQMFAGGPLGSAFGAPPASVGFGSALSGLGPLAPAGPQASDIPGPLGGGTNVSGAAQAAYGAGQQALAAAKQSSSQKGNAGGETEKLKALEANFHKLESEFNEVKIKVSNLEGQVSNRA